MGVLRVSSCKKLLLTFKPHKQFEICKSMCTQVPKLIIPPELPRHHKSHGDLTYVGNLTKLIKRVKRFSFFTSGIALAFQPLFYSKLAASSVMVSIPVIGTSGFFIVMLPIGLHQFAKRYITHMYYNGCTEEFTATRLTFFLRSTDFKFKKDDVEVLYNSSIAKSCTIKSQPYLLDDYGFLNKDVFMKFKKYDEPIDFSLDNSSGGSDKR